MEQNIEKKLEFKSRVLNFYDTNKVKIYIMVIILFVSLVTFLYINYKTEKNNILIAEKYVEARLYLASDKKENATKIYEEIVLSNNKIYSILALNTLVEKNLITEKKKILEYFEVLKNSVSRENQRDLIVLKKALYLIKESDVQKGNDLLEDLIDNKSVLAPIAKELLEK